MRGDENNSIEYYQNGEWQSFAGPFEPYEIHKCEELDMKVDDDPNKKVTNIYKKVGNSGISHLDPRNAKQAMTFASQVCSSRIQAHHHEGLYSQNAGIRQVKWGFFEKIFQPKSPRWLLGWFTQMESFVQTDHVGKFLESGIGPSFDRNMFQPTSLFFASFFLGREGNPSYQLIPSKNCSVDKFAVLQSHLKTMTTFHLWDLCFRWAGEIWCVKPPTKDGDEILGSIRGKKIYTLTDRNLSMI